MSRGPTCTSAIFNPARMAIVPQLVPAERLGSANSAIASTDRVVEILGALVAGFLVASVGVAAFYVDAATFAISAFLVSAVSARGTPHAISLRSLLRDAAAWQFETLPGPATVESCRRASVAYRTR